MTNYKQNIRQEPKIDFNKLLLEISPEEVKKLRDAADERISKEEMEDALKEKKLEKITQFSDKRVKPFGLETFYDVYCREVKTVTTLNGMQVQGLFGNDYEAKKDFAAKKLGTVYEGKGYRITFKWAQVLQ